MCHIENKWMFNQCNHGILNGLIDNLSNRMCVSACLWSVLDMKDTSTCSCKCRYIQPYLHQWVKGHINGNICKHNNF